MGPALKDIALKYASDKEAQAKLERSTQRRLGCVGTIPMPATEDGQRWNIKAMVAWILSIK